VTAAELGLPNDARVARCLRLLREFFPGHEDALKWLRTPHPDLSDRTALDVLGKQPDALLTLLSNAWEGIP
jgi:uncharacterized protein (DUF2384 family)